VRGYRAADAERWDLLCARSRNATFLHTRRFLSYHGDRFVDRSCVVERDGELVGVFPAAASPTVSTCAVSHPGATYGGLIHCGALAGAAGVEALREIGMHLRREGFRTLRYKAVPHIYQVVPAQEDLYALFRLGATRDRVDLSCAIDLQSAVPLSTRRRRGYRKALTERLRVEVGLHQLAEFWPVLCDNLAGRHAKTPPHSLDEISALAARLPEQLQLVCARHAAAVVAGALIFVTPRVHHAQYIGSSPAGRSVGGLDAVFQHCIEWARGRTRYFDFGISTEREGLWLNEGLDGFKREFGGGGVVHEHFSVDLDALPQTETGAASR
jgi:hypothetical protein